MEVCQLKELLAFPKERRHPIPCKAARKAPGLVRRQKGARLKSVGSGFIWDFGRQGKVGQGKQVRIVKFYVSELWPVGKASGW